MHSEHCHKSRYGAISIKLATCLRISCVEGASEPLALDIINYGCVIDPEFFGCQPMGNKHSLSIK